MLSGHLVEQSFIIEQLHTARCQEEPLPKVGLFWGYREELYHHSVDVASGEDDGSFVNGRYDHVDYWPLLEQRHRHLRVYDYEEVPRGRVIFIKDRGRYRIMCDKALITPLYLGLIREVFDLHEEETEVLQDMHYTTDPDALAALFGGVEDEEPW